MSSRRFPSFPFTLSVLALASLPACGDREDAARAREEIGEAADATAEYLENRRREFVADAEERIDVLRDDLAALKEEAADASGAAKEDLDATVARLKEELGRTEERLADVKSRGAEALDELSKGFDDAMTDLKASFRAAKERFRSD